MVSINRQACNGCGLCVEVCPTGALQLIESLIQVDGNLCDECDLCVDACPEEALVSYTIVEETSALAPRSMMGALDVAETNDSVKNQITRSATINIDTSRRNLGDWLGAAFNFLVFDLGQVIEGIIDTGQTQKGSQKRSIRQNESNLGERRGRGRNGRKTRRRRRGRW